MVYRAQRGGGGRVWGGDYTWVNEFWRHLVGQRHGRKWLVLSLFEGDLRLRDPLAFSLVRERLAREGLGDRASYRFVRAWSKVGGEPLPPAHDVILLGRPKAYSLNK